MSGFGDQKENTANTQSRQITGAQLLEKAVNFHKDGQVAEAEIFYLQAIEAGFHHEIAFSNLGVIYKNTNRSQEAAEIYKRAILLNPRFADAHANLGNLYKELGKLDQALSSTLKSLELKPDNPAALMNLGAIYLDLRLYKNAMTSTQKSIKIQPENPLIHVNLAEIFKEMNNIPKAIESINYAIKLDSQSAKAHLLSARISLLAGNTQKAEESLLKSIELDDRSSASYRYLSIISYMKGDYKASTDTIAVAINLDPNSICNKEVQAILRGKLKDGDSVRPSVQNYESKDDQRLHFPFTMNRPVDIGLIQSLYGLEYLDLEKRNLPTKGHAKTSNFSFFNEHKILTHSVEQDLIALAKKAIGTDICIRDSWFTILSGGGSVNRHCHLSELNQIKGFGDQLKKYALVYYLDIGDQSTEEPGYLRFYDPDDLILPSNGMVIIFPADRYHSVKYSGSKDRVIIGANFWSI